ncbi:MAG: methylmalonyl-CoA mutase, partial [Chloroflexi bacterium]|nr:methylmalonyl-CoA mutase [Chloroflexota bacterium]
MRKESARWRDNQDPSAQRKLSFKTPSQVPIEQVYTPENIADESYLANQGLPGEYPYLRGVHASGYRGRLWTMRMFAGFGLP